MKRFLIKYWLRSLAALFALVMLVSCSLLKVSVSTGEPLAKNDMNTRILTRGFYYDMSSEVARTADSIVKVAPDLKTRITATRWKIKMSSAGLSASMQGIGDVALADLWILCRRQDAVFMAQPDSLLFGVYSALARETTSKLVGDIEGIARECLPEDRYVIMHRFVEEFLKNHPLSEVGNAPSSTLLEWMQFLKDEGIETDYTTGSIAEVLSDVNDRVSGQTQQISNSLSWSKDILQMQLQQDSLHTELRGQLDSLERNFNRIVVVAEHLPEISEEMMKDLRGQLSLLIATMNYSLDNAFMNVERQREAIEEYLSKERQTLVEDLTQSAEGLRQKTMDALPMLVGEVLLYVVLALVVLIGGPFAVGFWLGGVRQRAKERKKDKHME